MLGEIPSNWKRYTVRRDLSLVQWLSDFAKRLAQLQAFLEGSLESVDIGLLFHPSAYITATRQSTAQKNGWSLETLFMEIDLGSTDSTRGYVVTGKQSWFRLEYKSWADHSWFVTGLQIEGGQVENGGLSLNEGGTSLVGASTIRWQQKASDTRSGRADNSTVDLPMYVNGERQALLATIKVGLNDDLTRVKVVQRGCCLKTSM
jgi:dynein heavy chain 1